jgi:hypothetical protein
MATALMAWLRAPAPTTWTSTAPFWRSTPAIAPATEFGFDFVDTLSCSIIEMVRQGMEGSLPAGSSGFSAFGQVVIEVVTVRA